MVFTRPISCFKEQLGNVKSPFYHVLVFSLVSHIYHVFGRLQIFIQIPLCWFDLPAHNGFISDCQVEAVQLHVLRADM